MKKRDLIFISIFLTQSLLAQEKTSADVDLKVNTSRALAQVLWETMDNYVDTCDPQLVIEELSSIQKGHTKLQESVKNYELLARAHQEIILKQSTSNLKKANEYLESLSDKPEYVSLIDGKLYYKILEPGVGSPHSSNTSRLLRFIEKTPTGEILKSSKGPISINLTQTVKGFSLGVKSMKPKEKREIIVHPELAYGELSRNEPNLIIIYEVECFDEYLTE